jgi:hypothetical protein
MGGAEPLLPLHVFMACMGITFLSIYRALPATGLYGDTIAPKSYVLCKRKCKCKFALRFIKQPALKR